MLCITLKLYIQWDRHPVKSGTAWETGNKPLSRAGKIAFWGLGWESWQYLSLQMPLHGKNFTQGTHPEELFPQVHKLWITEVCCTLGKEAARTVSPQRGRWGKGCCLTDTQLGVLACLHGLLAARAQLTGYTGSREFGNRWDMCQQLHATRPLERLSGELKFGKKKKKNQLQKSS